MPDARIFAAALAALVLGGCQKQQSQQDQNIVVTNDFPANADIETLPPDESVPNGTENADAYDLNGSQNSY